MSARYTIAAARERDIGMLAAIELAAARLLTGHAPESVLQETTTEMVLEQARRDGHLWVVLADDVPVGFAHVEIVEPNAVHLEEIDMHPGHGRQGLGTRLLLHVCDWATRSGFESVSLTTFRDVPWNMPFYARFGFAIVQGSELSAPLRRVVEDEGRRGLDPSRRVVMRKPCAVMP
jgi:GNAT superfamily N-acetyltransferase